MLLGAGFVVPEHAALAHGDATDAHAARLQIGEHLGRGQIHLLAKTLCNDGDVDMGQKLVRVAAQAAAIQRRQKCRPPGRSGRNARPHRPDARRDGGRGSHAG